MYQRTPLHSAAAEGYLNTVKYLLEKKSDIDIEDKYKVSDTILLISTAD